MYEPRLRHQPRAHRPSKWHNGVETFRKLIRALDFIFVVSERAQQAQMGARVRGVQMGTMYDGGLGVTAEHILPEFKSGKPPVSVETHMRVGRLGEHGELTESKAVYDPAIDSFRFSNIPYPREPGDLWLPEYEYEEAFVRAVRRASDSPFKPASGSH